MYIAASFLVCPGWFLCYCVTKLMWHQGGNCSTLTFCPLTLPFFSAPSPSLPHHIPTFPTFCPHSVKHCKRFELCKGLFLNTYFVHNVKPESVYFGKKKMFCVWNHSFIETKKRNYKKVKQTFTINNMKCSAVRKDFWCLTNKVNQIIRNLPALLWLFLNVSMCLASRTPLL